MSDKEQLLSIYCSFLDGNKLTDEELKKAWKLQKTVSLLSPYRFPNETGWE